MNKVAERCRQHLSMSQFYCKEDLFQRLNMDRQDAASEIDRLCDNVEFWKGLAEQRASCRAALAASGEE